MVISKSSRQNLPAQSRIAEAYGRGYLQGVFHGININAQDHESAQRLFSKLSIQGSSDQDPARRVVENLVNGAIENGGRRIEEATPAHNSAVTKEIEDVGETVRGLGET
ncbi:hypothetical protein IFR04_008159 [Cadophora malorum]|uniref:Uncharacterized protein n=1 Tax=Cadophora malorum TaxID=108018 RepID=A0A8H7TBU7_9HELO|nr:hypothetical protein IFR04_008159 [Cadophora malorum]